MQSRPGQPCPPHPRPMPVPPRCAPSGPDCCISIIDSLPRARIQPTRNHTWDEVVIPIPGLRNAYVAVIPPALLAGSVFQVSTPAVTPKTSPFAEALSGSHILSRLLERSDDGDWYAWHACVTPLHDRVGRGGVEPHRPCMSTWQPRFKF